jgi:hypothetical protein
MPRTRQTARPQVTKPDAPEGVKKPHKKYSKSGGRLVIKINPNIYSRNSVRPPVDHQYADGENKNSFFKYSIIGPAPRMAKVHALKKVLSKKYVESFAKFNLTKKLYERDRKKGSSSSSSSSSMDVQDSGETSESEKKIITSKSSSVLTTHHIMTFLGNILDRCRLKLSNPDGSQRVLQMSTLEDAYKELRSESDFKGPTPGGDFEAPIFKMFKLYDELKRQKQVLQKEDYKKLKATKDKEVQAGFTEQMTNGSDLFSQEATKGLTIRHGIEKMGGPIKNGLETIARSILGEDIHAFHLMCSHYTKCNHEGIVRVNLSKFNFATLYN